MRRVMILEVVMRRWMMSLVQQRLATVNYLKKVLTKMFQAKFDSTVDGIMVKINKKYPEGCCGLPEHATVQCFFHRPTDRHFVLTENMKRHWAARIVCISLCIQNSSD